MSRPDRRAAARARRPLRRDDARNGTRQAATLVDQGVPPKRSSVGCLHRFGNLGDLRIADLSGVGKPPRCGTAATRATAKRDLGKQKGHLGRHKLIGYGRQRADQGAGPVTVGIDMGVIKMILPRAAAVHRRDCRVWGVDLARTAPKRPGLIGGVPSATAARRRQTEAAWSAAVIGLCAGPGVWRGHGCRRSTRPKF